MSETGKIRAKLYRTLLLGITAALCLLAVSYASIVSLCTEKSKEDSLYEMQTAIKHIIGNNKSATELNDRFNSSIQAQTNTLAIIFSLSDELLHEDGVLQCAQNSGVDDLLILSPEGRVLCSARAVLDQSGNVVRYENGGILPTGLSYDDRNSLLSGTETFLVNLKTGVTTSRYQPLEYRESGVEKRYFSKSYQNGNVVITSKNTIKLKQGMAAQSSIANVLKKVTLGANSFIFAASEADQTILYYPDAQYIGRTLTEAGIPESCLKNGFSGELTIDETRYFCNTLRSWDGVMLVSAVPYGDISSERSLMTLSLLTITSILLIAYAYFLKKYSYQRGEVPDKLMLGKELYVNKNIAKKLVPVIAAVIAAAALSIVYIQALHAISEQAVTAKSSIGDIKAYLEANEERARSLTEEYEDTYLKKARMIALLLETNPSLLACDESKTSTDRAHTHQDGAKTVAYSKVLQSICDTMHIDAIYVFDEKGQSICTNTSLWYYPIEMKDENAQSYAFSGVIRGYVDSVVQDAMLDDTGRLNQYIGCSYTYDDEKGVQHNGLVEIAVHPSKLAETLKTTELTYQLNGMRVGRHGFFGAVNADDLTVSYSPLQDSLGKPATDIGFGEESFRDGWSGFAKINGYEYYSTCTRIGNNFVYTLMSLSNLYAQGYTITLYTALFNLAFAFILLCTVVFGLNRHDSLYKLSAGKKLGGKTIFDLVTPDGSVKRVSSAVSRWDDASIPWIDKNPDQRLFTLLKLLLGVVAVILCVMFIGAQRLFGSNSILGYIMEGSWDRGVNIFSLTCCAMIMLIVIVIGDFVAMAIRTASINLGSRTETIGRLLSGVIRFAAIVFGIFRSLMLLGVDAAALIASAGILTLVIGLGAQKLIADFLAGIFIVFEGSFRVGDIVTIGDFRGSVLEIGMRTTKIMDASGDIKILNNSDISGILNMTKEMSFAFCDVGIEYSESIERVEMVLKDAFPLIRRRLPAIIEGPFYKGISELGDSCVVIKIMAKCAEQDRLQLNRDLNREIKLVFDKNNINIPYPQMVLSYRQDTQTEQISDNDRRRAARFVDEQKVKSKDIEDEK